jgi:phosphoribosylformimino-5-aminoimidazole carboxamide ribotide isomerase
MRVVGVLDLLGGVVVRGVAGRRSEYRPVVSRLTASSEPLAVARALRRDLGLSELYVADLDAISGGLPAWDTFAALRADGFTLWVDAGVRDLVAVVHLADRGIGSVVIGLETVCGPEVLAGAVHAVGSGVVFSLDFRGGSLLGDLARWRSREPAAVAEEAIALGVRRLLILDLARVGVGTGTGTEELCARLAAAHPEVEIAAGGGIRGKADLERLRDLGLAVVLVASALHDASLTRDDLTGL